ncbi:hypothetical protein GYMLUDRAFT_178145 [Collybiopsis luxurians FD-317 M1]|uniref:NmrA-like domain-containing protein n=1 Tax=Collybiopsis luxurians FD-317 M1 TaxID=944289 RepID=A0A0D0BWI2_9AGAR|nr:hypothetical protein GYMLUDRAFT_178145 [Collybiopsis luxurians FD-317 M1]
MSSSARSVAIIGAGYIGTPIARALLNTTQHPKVIVLTRHDSTGKSLPDDLSSIPIIPVDYSDVAAVTKVFKDHSVDVVVSTLPMAGLKAQYSLADAAKASGTVKLFVPSEWGLPSEGAKARGTSDLFAEKDELVEYLKSIQLPFTRVYTGFFIGALPFIAGVVLSGKVSVVGKGDTPFTAVSEADIGAQFAFVTGFVAHVLTSLPLDSPHLVNNSLRLEGDRLTFQDLARIYEKPIHLLAEGELAPGRNKDESQFMTALQAEAEAGRASTGFSRVTWKDEGSAGSTNGLWEGHVWDKVKKID